MRQLLAPVKLKNWTQRCDKLLVLNDCQVMMMKSITAIIVNVLKKVKAFYRYRRLFSGQDRSVGQKHDFRILTTVTYHLSGLADQLATSTRRFVIDTTLEGELALSIPQRLKVKEGRRKTNKQTNKQTKTSLLTCTKDERID